MKLRLVCVLVCACLVAYSVTSLFAKPEAVFACCSGTECGSAKCCDYAMVGQPPCSSDMPNWCMSECIPVGGR